MDSTHYGRLLASAAYLTLATSAVAAKAPDKLVLTPESPTALLVMQSDWWQPAPDMQSAFKLAFSTYDPVAEKIEGGPFSSFALFEAKKKNFIDGYMLTPIKPGHWVFLAYSQQDKWSLCYNAASWQFHVKPGEVIFMGSFDAQRERRELTEQTLRSGKVSLRNTDFASFFDLPAAPTLAPIDDAQVAQVQAVLKQRAPLITAPVRAAVYSAARFGTGSSLFGQRVCGGYFIKGAKEMKDRTKIKPPISGSSGTSIDN